MALGESKIGWAATKMLSVAPFARRFGLVETAGSDQSRRSCPVSGSEWRP